MSFGCSECNSVKVYEYSVRCSGISQLFPATFHKGKTLRPRVCFRGERDSSKMGSTPIGKKYLLGEHFLFL